MSETGVQTLDRTLDIIELLAVEPEGIGVSEIGLRLGLHKSTVHRLLNALAVRGYIEKEAKFGMYKLGLKFIEISSHFLNKLELKTEALSYLRKLSETVGQTVHLAILSGSEAIYIEKIDSLSSIRMYSQIGRRIPVHCSAIGKVLLSGLKNDELKKITDEIEYKGFTPFTIKTSEDLINEVKKVKKAGYATDNEEHEEGIRCIAAPIYDYTGRVIASVSTSGDKKIISKDREEEISKYVIEAVSYTHLTLPTNREV